MKERPLIEHAALAQLVDAHKAQATIVADPEAGGWGVVIRIGKKESTLAARRGSRRLFAKTDTAVGYLRSLGLMRFSIDAEAFDPTEKTSPRAARPDRARALRQTHAAGAHDAWFRQQVQIGLAQLDAGKGIGEVEHEARWAKRRAALARRAKSTGK